MTELAAGQTHAETNTTPQHVFLLMFLHQNTQDIICLPSDGYGPPQVYILPNKIVHLHRNPQDAAFFWGGAMTSQACRNDHNMPLLRSVN